MPSGPKATKFMNRHAAEAQEREASRAAESKAKRAKEQEEAQWADVDKETARAEARRAEAEAKRQAELARKAENKELYESEQASATKGQPAKVSKRQMQKDMAKLLAAYDKEMAVARPDLDTEARRAEEERKRASAGKTVRPEELALDKADAKKRNEEALAAEVPDDRVIGRRAKVLYQQFKVATLTELKKEKPGLRRSQYDDLLWEMWQKSPQNPFVRRAEARAVEAMERERTWMQASDDDDDKDVDETA